MEYASWIVDLNIRERQFNERIKNLRQSHDYKYGTDEERHEVESDIETYKKLITLCHRIHEQLKRPDAQTEPVRQAVLKLRREIKSLWATDTALTRGL